ncbi:MAG TPA: DUF5916 domain-containing protein [Longimicrobium sp.]|jgi:hypothetical protein|uniref:DUF5916 domain-containing protein n=1 Tax=Longimicrobium sp. TaxID=2029185 RepID=UPI002EDA25E2
MPNWRFFACVAAALTGASSAAAQQQPAHSAAPTPQMQAVRGTEPISIDGRLDEAVWRSAQPATDFRQQDPHEGQPASERTEVRIAYDDEALYIGARMHDSLGAAGVRTRLGRRDEGLEGDYIQLVFDTYHDHTGRTVLQVNPSGVKYDAGQSSPYADPSWDPVYTVATRVDSAGWTAEFRVPFSQLRYPSVAEQVWGMQVWRFIERKNEQDMWSFWGKGESGGPSRFGHVSGLRAPRHRRSVELLPYVLARGSFVQPVQPGSPFEDRRSGDVRVGGDVKALLTSTLTLDATINPDFGQVEVDPAVVNLSQYETFFSEKRPFFIEGSGLFDFGEFNCHFCSNISSMSPFYSRRIGRSPQGFVTQAAAFTHSPESSNILGAAKVTGRLAGGLQVGVMDAVTRRERALAISPEGDRFTEEVEPATNYFVGRVRQNMRGGNVTVGGLATSVLRGFDSDALRGFLPSRAEAVGADWSVYWKDRRYGWIGNLVVSEAGGDSAAIMRLQNSPARYFQRPDRDAGVNGVFSDRLDPRARSLRGIGGYTRVAKDAGDWQWETALDFRSPGFETNDLGYLPRADYVWGNANLIRVWNRPTRRYRDMAAIIGSQQQVNFDGDLTGRDFHVYLGGQLANYWRVSGFSIVNTQFSDDRLTRGGPVVRNPADFLVALNVSTDPRRKVVLSTNPRYITDEDGGWNWSADLSVRVKPVSNVQFSVGPAYSSTYNTQQYVAGFADATADHFFGQRAVFSDLHQRTLSMNTRLNWTFSPTLTLELFAQPFIATGEFDRFKEFTATRTLDKREFDAAQITPLAEDGRVVAYSLNPDRNAATPAFVFGNPDFNFRSLRGNAVVRWEYRPGSTLFFVWQQQRAGAEGYGDFAFRRDADAVFRQQPDNVFVIKASYWIGR